MLNDVSFISIGNGMVITSRIVLTVTSPGLSSRWSKTEVISEQFLPVKMLGYWKSLGKGRWERKKKLNGLSLITCTLFYFILFNSFFFYSFLLFFPQCSGDSFFTSFFYPHKFDDRSRAIRKVIVLF